MNLARLFILLILWVPWALGASTNRVFCGLRWRSGLDRHDAAIPGWPVSQVLGRLKAQTGWKILLESGIQTQVKARFAGLSTRDAFPRILGGLNYSFTPSSNGISLLRVFRSTASSAGEEIIADVDAGLIGNELIVRLKAGTDLDASKLALKWGAESLGTNGFAVLLKFESEAAAAAALAKLESDPEVAAVENNREFAPPEIPSRLTEGRPSPLNLAPTVTPDGTRRVIALIDSGVQPMGPEFQSFMLPSVPIVAGAGVSEEPTHGTSMAEAILRGLAAASPNNLSSTRVRPYDVYGANVSTSTWDVTQAVVAAVQEGATIVNLSLGSSEGSPYLRDVIRSVTDQGVMVIAAAGNEAGTAPFYPAAYESTLAVTASTSSRNGQLAGYANFGTFVDLAVPGSTQVTINGASWTVQGTSVSAAFASGMAGGLAMDPRMNLTPIRATLTTRFPFRRP